MWKSQKWVCEICQISSNFVKILHLAIQSHMTSQDFINISSHLMSYNRHHTASSRDFHSLFGTSPEVCSEIWNMVAEDNDKPFNLRIALYFLKNYPTETILCSFFHLSEKTMRKILWEWVERLSNMTVVRFHELYVYFG